MCATENSLWFGQRVGHPESQSDEADFGANTSTVLDPQQRARLDRSQMVRDMIVSMHTLNVDFYPRESRVATFRDPYSFPILFHPACNNLVREHLGDLARKVGYSLIRICKLSCLRRIDCVYLRGVRRISCYSLLSTASAYA